MEFMIFIFDDRSPDPGLVPYTGVKHETKQSALSEYLEACDEHGRGKTYLVIV